MKLLIFTLISFLFTACDLFLTREAELPDQARSNFQVATEPEIVIQNLTNAFTDKNVQNYISCFLDSSFSDKKFSFQPSGEVISQYPFLSENWSIDDEQRYFNSLTSGINADFPLSLSFNDESFVRSGDSVIYSATYSISLPVSEPEVSSYQGSLQFYLIPDDRAVWVIYYWLDIKLTGVASWSELKGRFY